MFKILVVGVVLGRISGIGVIPVRANLCNEHISGYDVLFDILSLARRHGWQVAETSGRDDMGLSIHQQHVHYTGPASQRDNSPKRKHILF